MLVVPRGSLLGSAGLPWSETADKCEIVISVQIQRSAFC